MDAKLAMLMSVIAFVINIIGLAIPYWLELSRSEAGQSSSYNTGLWSMCARGYHNGTRFDYCYSYYQIDGEVTLPKGILQARYIEIAASILMFCSTVWGVIQTVLHTPKALFTKPSRVVCFIAGILALVGCIVYATDSVIKTLVSSGYHYHAGFAMCIEAGVLSGLLYILARKNTQPVSPMLEMQQSAEN